jgi:hypothetical protein
MRSASPNRSLKSAARQWQAAALCAMACVAGPRGSPAQLERLCVDGHRFVECASRKAFAPHGFNYDHDRHFRLIEDYWDTEWSTVLEDFSELRALGANTVRVHLQLGRFLNGPQSPNPQALSRLDALLTLAEQERLRLIITGLGEYRPADAPAWYDGLAEAERWHVQRVFWTAVAARGAHSSAVFAYDLMNEPVVPGDPQSQWPSAAEIDGLHFLQHVTLDRAGRPAPEIAAAWVRPLAEAVRAADPRALVTVGMFPAWEGINPQDIARFVDYQSVHLYPRSGQFPEALDALRAFNTWQPVLIEELGPLYCSVDELEAFMNDARPLSAGALGFYWGETIAELEGSATPRDALLLGWLRMLMRVH